MLGLLKWLRHDDRIGLHAEIIALHEAEQRQEELSGDSEAAEEQNPVQEQILVQETVEES